MRPSAPTMPTLPEPATMPPDTVKASAAVLDIVTLSPTLFRETVVPLRPQGLMPPAARAFQVVPL